MLEKNELNADIYQKYLQKQLKLNINDYPGLIHVIQNTQWEEPEVPADWNNIAVIALIEAEENTGELRQIYLDYAIEALNQGELKHPLCAIHLNIINLLIGEQVRALETSLNTVVETLQANHSLIEPLEAGLLYLPTELIQNYPDQLIIHSLFQFQNGKEQVLGLVCLLLQHIPLAFYGQIGLRYLNFVHHLQPDSIKTNIQLGIACLTHQQTEGLIYLLNAHDIAPRNKQVLQTLFFAYKDMGLYDSSEYWFSKYKAEAQLEFTQNYAIELNSDSEFAYFYLKDGILLSIQPSLRSIVTNVLMGMGDWFEAELNWWRNVIQPGMTILDIGANVGVYTFSAAVKVGSTGKVLAIEPFPACVQSLNHTSEINSIDCVTIISGAASNKNGFVSLALHGASELNEVIVDGSENLENSINVPCYTLDQIMIQEHLTSVDYIKLDAEKHELEILEGSQELINAFHPTILYENIAANSGNNIGVAEFLKKQGYALYFYLPFTEALILLETEEDLNGKLNIIAKYTSS